MNAVNRLGLRVAVIAALLIAIIAALVWGVQAFLRGKEEAASPTPSALAPVINNQNEGADQDSDGLADLVENLYRTDPAKADTDGDGMSDGDEVLAGHNPLVTGDTGGDIPLGENVLTQNTWTQKYLASLPSDLPREEVLDQERVEAFVNQNVGELLPTLPEGTIKTKREAGKAAVSAYLDSVSASHNPDVVAISNADIEEAFRLHFVNNNSERIDQVISELDINAAKLADVVAPAETEELHTKLVVASYALAQRTKDLKNMTQDFVGGLIAAKAIDGLGAIFQEVAAEVAALEAKYSLE